MGSKKVKAVVEEIICITLKKIPNELKNAMRSFNRPGRRHIIIQNGQLVAVIIPAADSDRELFKKKLQREIKEGREVYQKTGGISAESFLRHYRQIKLQVLK